MKIEKVKKLKNGKYKITFDSEETLITYDEVIIKNMLFNGKEVNNEILSNISLNNEYYDIYNKIVKMISAKWRSQKEIEVFLTKTELSEEQKDKILKDLIKNDLINDKRYARSYANDAINLSKHGPYKIKEDLLKQGISEVIVEDIVTTLDEDLIDLNLTNIIEKKNRLNSHYSSYQLKMKLSNELINLGYEKEKINTKLNEIIKDNQDIAKKEYEKILRKYAKKYTGKELEYKVKQAMYQKGFGHYEE
ncbi:MAG: RecX family transcriptional regulator [Bacilli bacterium]|nr:RecX family transcriptional regulator [Bacilli bacterium]